LRYAAAGANGNEPLGHQRGQQKKGGNGFIIGKTSMREAKGAIWHEAAGDGGGVIRRGDGLVRKTKGHPFREDRTPYCLLKHKYGRGRNQKKQKKKKKKHSRGKREVSSTTGARSWRFSSGAGMLRNATQERALVG